MFIYQFNTSQSGAGDDDESALACVAGARLNRAQVIQTGACERSQSREEKVERALSRACLHWRARLTRVLAEHLLRSLRQRMLAKQLRFKQ